MIYNSLHPFSHNKTTSDIRPLHSRVIDENMYAANNCILNSTKTLPFQTQGVGVK